MKKLYVFLICMMLMINLVGCASSQEKQVSEDSKKETVTFVDDANREIEIPSKIEKVYCTSSLGAIFLYTLDVDKLATWDNRVSIENSEFVNEKLKELPNAGSLQGKDSANIEEIMKLNPDLILSMGDINEQSISVVEKFQKQSGIPIILIDGSLEKTAESYIKVGKLLGCEEQASKLANYCDETIKSAKQIANSIPEDEKVTVYYAQGEKGLQTDPVGSLHAQLIDLVGAKNVANFEIKDNHGKTGVSLEQVVNWNPQFILAESNSFDDPVWKQVDAVKNENVFLIPQKPFNWIDRPSSVNRIIGIKWAQSVLYKDYCDVDLEEETIKFFDLFYHVKISKEQARELLSME
ncbi:ABC transporter substrate-binding protein [Tepidibacter sp. Z1-5]|uniref:ABC transporter substrate-binding protein n=1 Tax=Tepidibacter sp. Z1-5 TaxID=3134138 RepID=UPI0030C2DE47